MKKLIISLFLMSFFLLTLEASVNIAVLSDSKSQFKKETALKLKQELQDLTNGEFKISFPRSKQFYGDFSTVDLKKHLKDLQEDSKVDMIITIGLRASQIARKSKLQNKAVFAPFIFQTITPKKDESGIKNFNYLRVDISFKDELERFLEVTNFSNLSIMIDEDLYQSFPKAIKHIKTIANEKRINLNFIRQKNPNDNLIDKIPTNSDAIMIAALPQITKKAKEELINGLILKKLPSYSLTPEINVEEGILASSINQDKFKRRLRKLSLNIQAVLRGEKASKQDILFKEKHNLTINMQTARSIDVYPNFKLLRDIKLLNEEQKNIKALTLEQIAKEAVQNNLSIISGKLGVKASEQTIEEVKSVFYPQITASLDYSQLNDDNIYVETGFYAQKTSEASISLQQILFSEKALANLEIQKELQISKEAQQEALELEVIKQATTLYLKVLVSKTYTKIASDNLALTQRNLKLAKSRVSSGASDRSDLYYWESKISSTKQNLLDAKANVSKVKDLLKRILHRPLEENISIASISLEQLHKLIGNQRLIKEVANEKSYKQMANFFIKHALKNAPELKSLNANLSAQRRQLLSQERDYYTPSVILAGEVNHVFDEQRTIDSFSLENDTNWQAVVKLSLPLYEGGAKNARKQRTQLQLQQLQSKYLDQIEGIKRNIWEDMHAIKASYPSIELSKQAAQSAQKSFELISANYAKGTRAMTDLLISQNAKLAADSASANAVYQFLIDFTKLQRDIASFDFFLNRKGYNTLAHTLETTLKTNKE
ncbi:TolC family protein [Poseidonibacter antarcticus]|uniref:TolC family protein n=1 Tax=Poseidonibacter antarcticus TaxID=2478538 RepID=UPI000EF54819|nr:TolC family protein [Poseidonibacter antarcticus]